MQEKIIKKEVVIDNVTLKVVISIPEDGGIDLSKYTIISVTTKGSKVDIQQLLNEDQFSMIHEYFEKNINEEVSYDINYEGRELKAYGIWKINETFNDNIPDFELTRVTKPTSNRNLLRYMDDLDIPYLYQLVENQN
ncbi:MAG TPA: hypothetical protein VLA48_03400 [Nitrososphaeraceae archaeon]|nr:hypothetical protein [Nitrososphaeraceae archaeon]